MYMYCIYTLISMYIYIHTCTRSHPALLGQTLCLISSLTHFPSTLQEPCSYLPSLYSPLLLTDKILTSPQQSVGSHIHIHAHMHAKKACCLATLGWDRCRPIREASERAVNQKSEPIDRGVPVHINLKQRGFNHFMISESFSGQQLLQSFTLVMLTKWLVQLIISSHIAITQIIQDYYCCFQHEGGAATIATTVVAFQTLLDLPICSSCTGFHFLMSHTLAEQLSKHNMPGVVNPYFYTR